MKKGFTLVELSIVLVIIGLLIGGTLVGQSMIRTVKIKKFHRQIVELETLTNMFSQQFKALPGDFAKADTILGATAGNGDRKISHAEYRDAFQQMAMAGFLPERYITIDINMSGSDYTTPHHVENTVLPTVFDDVGMNYGYTVWTGITPSDCTDGNDRREGHFFHIAKIDSTETDSVSLTGHSPARAFLSRNYYKALDAKFDDGEERQGKIWAYGDGGSYANVQACTGIYNTCIAGWPNFGGTYDERDTCGVLYWYDIH